MKIDDIATIIQDYADDIFALADEKGLNVNKIMFNIEVDGDIEYV